MRLLAVLAGVALAACAEAEAGAPVEPLLGVPEGHPCPEMAIPPSFAALYEEHILSGEPVPLAMLPPLDIGISTTVTQGNQMEPTHQGQQAYAWDFSAPVGASVHAAAPGVVVWVRDDSEEHGEEESHQLHPLLGPPGLVVHLRCLVAIRAGGEIEVGHVALRSELSRKARGVEERAKCLQKQEEIGVGGSTRERVAEVRLELRAKCPYASRVRWFPVHQEKQREKRSR